MMEDDIVVFDGVNMSKLSEADQKLIEMFPLRVEMPSLSGRKWLLTWEEQRGISSHVIVASSEQQAVAVFKRILDEPYKYDTSKPKDLLEVDIVSPSVAVQLANARARHEDEYSAFLDFVVDSCRRLAPELPPNFDKCPGFALAPDDKEDSSWKEEYHIGCVNCTAGALVFDGKKLYEERRDMWKQFDPNTSTPWWQSAHARVSTAAPADDRPLYYISSESGGTDLHETVNLSDVDRHTYACEKAFFCHIVNKFPIPAAITAHIQQLVSQRTQENNVRLETARELQELASYEHNKKLREFFKMPDLEMLLSDEEKQT